MKDLIAFALAAMFLAAPISAFADTPHQGSGKNEAGNVAGPFAGNPHDRPGANAKD